MRTSFQPDTLALMLVLLSLYILNRWRMQPDTVSFIYFSIILSIALLVKYPVAVPFLPLMGLIFYSGYLTNRVGILKNMIIAVVFIVLPFAAWSWYVLHKTDPVFLQGVNEMFFFGDLSRFFDFSFYLKLSFIFFIYLLCVVGIMFLLAGVARIKPWGWAAMLGIPLFLFIVPTSAVQHYYQYAITPIIAYLMAEGVTRFYDGSLLLRGKIRTAAMMILLTLYLASAFVASMYLLRHDHVFLEATKEINEISRPEDLVLSIALHDRVYIGALWYSETHYLSTRKGWNVAYDQRTAPDKLVHEVDQYRGKGARYILVTRYTPGLEPWFANYIPSRFKRDPHIDSQKIVDVLKQRYRILTEKPNFLIFAI
jgi:hypothetical protein